jgi:long-chain acyl-CoA synthetase
MNSFEFLFDLPLYQLNRNPQRVAGALWRQEVIDQVSSDQLLQLVRSFALKFLEQGIKKGDRIFLYTERFNIEWLAVDMAIMSCGAISVPISFPAKKEEFDQMLGQIEPSIIIYTTPVELPGLSGSSILISFEELIKSDKTITEIEIKNFEVIRASISPSDLATIVYTSGSSGEPKAVALSHQNLVSNVKSVLSLVPFKPGTKVLSFLPLSHIFQRIVSYVYLACGANIYFLEFYRNAIFALKDIRPEYFTSVPLILERFASIMEDRLEESSWFTRWAYKSWEKTNRGLLSHVGSLIAHQWIIKRWKHRMGGRLKGIVSGAAYLDPKIERLYERSGIKIRQGYGLTEASPIITLNSFKPGGHMRGTVGQPIPGVEVQIEENGEILVKGPNVMVGYYKDEIATNYAIMNGWLHTGDVGYWEKNHFLVITDRKSNVYKHASGKFISPAQIESKLIGHPLIQQAMIIGFMRPFTIALIIPDFEALKKVCEEMDIHWTAPQYMVFNTLVIQLYRDILDHLGLQSHERIEKFILIADTWSPENGLLTSTYKPRRKVIEEKYEKVIDEMYEG